jgi:hypothetical protein
VDTALQQALDQKVGAVFIRDPECRKTFAAMAPLCGLLDTDTLRTALEQFSYIAVFWSALPAIGRLKGSRDAGTVSFVPI